MIKSCSNCLIVAAVFQVIFGHDPRINYTKLAPDAYLGRYQPYENHLPKHCWHPPRGMYLNKCCQKPRLYSDKVMKRCGIEPRKKKNLINEIANSTPKGIHKTPCQDAICLMQNANLLKANGSIDYEKLGVYLDGLAAANPDFTEAILAAKLMCGKEKVESWYRVQLQLSCDHNRVYDCLMVHMLWNCKLKEFKECQILAKYMKECKPYYSDIQFQPY